MIVTRGERRTRRRLTGQITQEAPAPMTGSDSTAPDPPVVDYGQETTGSLVYRAKYMQDVDASAELSRRGYGEPPAADRDQAPTSTGTGSLEAGADAYLRWSGRPAG